MFSFATKAIQTVIGHGKTHGHRSSASSDRRPGETVLSRNTGEQIVLDPRGTYGMVSSAVDAIEAGSAVLVIDAKGEWTMSGRLSEAVRQAGKTLVKINASDLGSYTPPWDRLSSEAIATVLLSCAGHSDSYYRRVIHRHIVETAHLLKAAGVEPNLKEVATYGDPTELSKLAHTVDDQRCLNYLESLTARDKEVIQAWTCYANVLLSTDLERVLGRSGHHPQSLDSLEAIRAKAVVYFDLESYQWSDLSHVLCEAIMQDLLSAASELGGSSTPSLVGITGTSRIDPNALLKLSTRGRSAGIRVVMA